MFNLEIRKFLISWADRWTPPVFNLLKSSYSDSILFEISKFKSILLRSKYSKITSGYLAFNSTYVFPFNSSKISKLLNTRGELCFSSFSLPKNHSNVEILWTPSTISQVPFFTETKNGGRGIPKIKDSINLLALSLSHLKIR